MKSKFFAVIISLIVLVCLNPLYLSWKANVTVYTDAGQGVSVILHYTVVDQNRAYTQQKETKAQGKVKFTVSEKNIQSVHIETKAKVKKICFKGRKNELLKLNDDLSFNVSSFSSRRSFGFFKFMMCCATIVYFMAFLRMKSIASPSNLPKMMNMEFLRCFFCCEVVYQHIAEQLHFFTRSLLSVEFFFLLSGYLFFRTHCYERNLWDVFSKKIKAFLPLSLFGSLMVGCVYENLNGFLGDILFLNSSFLPSSYFNMPLWYLSCLLWMFLFYAFVLKTFDRKTAFFLLTILTLFGLFNFARDYDAHWRVGRSVLTGGLCRAMAGIGVGMFICYFSGKAQAHKLKSGVATVLECIALFGSIAAMHSKSIDHIIIFFGFALLIFLFIRKEGVLSCFFEKTVWGFLGKYTFAVYVTHDVFARRILVIMRDKYSFVSEHAVLSALLCYIVIFTVAVIAYHVIGTKKVDYARLFLKPESKE